jgi:hypothetical protein
VVIRPFNPGIISCGMVQSTNGLLRSYGLRKTSQGVPFLLHIHRPVRKIEILI